jgi:hypothetical protein
LSDNGRNGLKVVEDAEQQARAQLESIVAMVRAVNDAPSDEEREAALTAIYEDPLDVEVRGKWHPPNAPSAKACEFKILLCTGGPAVRIRGELDEHSEPESLRLEYQNWFTPWRTFAELTDAENDALLHYCRQFYFAE